MLNIAGGALATGYNLDKSLRFRASASAYLNRTLGTPTNGTKFTWSGWIKLGRLNNVPTIYGVNLGGAITDFGSINITVAGTVQYYEQQSNTAVATYQLAGVFLDPSAWYHLIIAVDTTQATASNRFLAYVNGVSRPVTTFTAFPQNQVTYMNRVGVSAALGGILYNSSYQSFLDGYLAEVNFIDGQALTPASFGSFNATTGVWQPAQYTGTYGTNGFYLDFEDTSSVSALGTDKSGNGNTWTVNNISLTAGVTYDSMTDVPTLTSATASNWCVMNAVEQTGTALSNGNLRVSTTANSWVASKATISIPTGKWYAEFYFDAVGGFTQVGVFKTSTNLPAAGGTGYPGFSPDGYTFQSDGNLYNNGGGTAYGSSLTTGDILMVAMDADNSKLFFGKNGTWFNSSDPAAGTNRAYAPVGVMSFVAASYGNNNGTSANFGQRPFAYTPPTGFLALNTFNLPTATILNGNTVMDATLYTGNGSTQTITNAAGFQPDLVWYKGRSFAYNHGWFDSVRGATNYLASNLTNAETSISGVTSFNSNGFTLGTSVNGNNSGTTYVGWQWKAGGAAVSNTAGSITSQVSANPSAGFSVVTYTGTGSAATVGHGLGVAPKMIIIKARNAASQNWIVYQASMDATPQNYVMGLNLTVAKSLDSTMLNNTAPTSSVFSIGTNTSVNNNTTTYVAYCWSEIDGFSKFGSYTGNGSTNGTFVYLGFRPKFVMLKRSDSTSNWYMFDTARNTFNVMTNELLANSSNAEANGNRWIDGLSNGFKIRNDAGNQINASGGTMIYMAFAENPFKNSLAR